MLQLNINTLGGLDIARRSAEIKIPTRKGKALLVYLALSPDGRRSREHLADELWGRSADEQARASLRQTLSSLRKALGREAGVISTSSESIALDLHRIDTDAAAFAALARSNNTRDLIRAAELYRGDFLQGFSLKEEAFEAWLSSERQRYRDIAASVLEKLVEHHSMIRDYEAALRFARQRLSLDPIQESAHRTLIELFMKSGRRESALRQYDDCVRTLRRELDVAPGLEIRALYEALLRTGDTAAEKSDENNAAEAAAGQTIEFCEAADGTRIAYATVGEGPPLVKTANWLNHLEFDWQSPIWRHYFRFLTQEHSLVRYDERGNGLSDWNAEDISFDAFVNDLEAVVDAAGVERFPLLGISQGCAVSIAYSIKHPHRVSGLILFGGYARGWGRRGDVKARDRSDALNVLIKDGWGKENPAFRQMFTSLFIPGAKEEQMDWFNSLQRMTASADNAIRLRRANAEIDVTHLLSSVSVPTLVLHSRGDEVTPLTESEYLAALIPGARLVVLESNNHLVLEHEPAWVVFCNEVRKFLINVQE